MLDNRILQWSELGNPKECQNLKKIKFSEQKDEFNSWITRYQSFFQSNRDLAEEESLLKEWAKIFGAVNITELLSEGSIKILKRYCSAAENPETTNENITLFKNKSIEETEEN